MIKRFYKYVILFSLLMGVFNSYSQQDSNIIHVENIKQLGRLGWDYQRKMVRYLAKNNWDSIRSMKNTFFVAKKGNYTRPVPLLYLNSRVFLDFYFEDYKSLFIEIKKLNSFDVTNTFNKKVVEMEPFIIFDQFAYVSSDFFRKKSDSILANIDKSELQPGEKKMLRLLFVRNIGAFTPIDPDMEEYIHKADSLNFEANKLLQIKELEPYYPFIKMELQFNFIQGDDGIKIFFEGNIPYFGGQLKNQLSNPGGADFAVDIPHKKWIYDGKGYFYSGFLKTSFDYTKNWVTGNNLDLSGLSLNLGYNIFDKYNFSINPFVGMGFSWYSVGGPNRGDTSVTTCVFQPLFTLQLNYKIAVGHNKRNVKIGMGQPFLVLSLSGGYAPIMLNCMGGPRVSMTTINMGLGFFMLSSKRDISNW